MQNDPFVILGIDRYSTQAEIKEAYEKLHNRYAQDRFEEGEKGAEAARMYNVIEDAYEQAMAEYDKEHVEVNESYNSATSFNDVRNALKNGKINEAQEILDDIMDRSAEWHFYQAAIFHRKNWFDESRKQLEISVKMEPNNFKYKDALDKLVAEQNKTNPFNQNQNQNQNSSPYNRSYDQSGPAAAGAGICDCCTSLLCLDCCCECMGGDLISCC